MVTHENLLAVMESRFDFSSARAILAEALTRARVAGRKEFGADELRAVAAVMPMLAGRTETLVARLAELADGMGRSGKAAPKPAAEPAVEPAPVEASPEAEREPGDDAPAGDEPAGDEPAAEAGAEAGEGGGEKRRDKQGKKKR